MGLIPSGPSFVGQHSPNGQRKYALGCRRRRRDSQVNGRDSRNSWEGMLKLPPPRHAQPHFLLYELG